MQCCMHDVISHIAYSVKQHAKSTFRAIWIEYPAGINDWEPADISPHFKYIINKLRKRKRWKKCYTVDYINSFVYTVLVSSVYSIPDSTLLYQNSCFSSKRFRSSICSLVNPHQTDTMSHQMYSVWVNNTPTHLDKQEPQLQPQKKIWSVCFRVVKGLRRDDCFHVSSS